MKWPEIEKSQLDSMWMVFNDTAWLSYQNSRFAHNQIFLFSPRCQIKLMMHNLFGFRHQPVTIGNSNHFKWLEYDFVKHKSLISRFTNMMTKWNYVKRFLDRIASFRFFLSQVHISIVNRIVFNLNVIRLDIHFWLFRWPFHYLTINCGPDETQLIIQTIYWNCNQLCVEFIELKQPMDSSSTICSFSQKWEEKKAFDAIQHSLNAASAAVFCYL